MFKRRQPAGVPAMSREKQGLRPSRDDGGTVSYLMTDPYADKGPRIPDGELYIVTFVGRDGPVPPEKTKKR